MTKLNKILLLAFVVVATAVFVIDTTKADEKDKYNNSEIKEKYKLEKTSFIKEAKDENSVKIKIGNDSDEFVPEFEISHWEDEVKMKIKPRFTGNLDFEGKKIKFKTQDKEQ